MNADDLGAYTERSTAIFAAFTRGVVSSATLICNGHDALQAATHAKSIAMPVGLHVNVSDGKPMSQPSEIPTLVDAAGMFFGRLGLRSALDAGRIDPCDIERECQAQFDWFFRHCGTPTHIDGHQHMHVHPCVLPLLTRCMAAHGIRRIRIPDELLPSSAAVHLQQAAFDARAARAFVAAQGLFSPMFCGMLFAEHASIETFTRLVSKLPEGITELMVHPGDPVTGRGGFDMHPHRQAERDMLLSAEAKRVLHSQGVALLSFADV